MRSHRRYVAVLALAAAAALAAVAIATAAPNGNSSSLTGSKFSPSTLPRDNFKAGSLFVHTHSNYANPGNYPLGGATDRSQLYFDDDGKLNIAGVPTCQRSQLEGVNMQTAMQRCSTAKIGSGKAKAFAQAYTINACVLVFNGPKNANNRPTNFVFTRANANPPGTISCTSPSSNTQGNTTVLLEGVVKPNPSSLSGDFRDPDGCSPANGAKGCMVDYANINTASPFPLTDFQVTVKRGSFISARCHDTDKRLNIKGKFTYSDGQSDTVSSSQGCTVG